MHNKTKLEKIVMFSVILYLYAQSNTNPTYDTKFHSMYSVQPNILLPPFQQFKFKYMAAKAN